MRGSSPRHNQLLFAAHMRCVIAKGTLSQLLYVTGLQAIEINQ